MEGDSGSNATGDQAAGSSSSSNSRWNPTKEQINMLENLYKQGVRTPSAEQIEQITSRLTAFGHIEGKNVFYWFQNHKARQRQKQKQESLAYFNRFVRNTPPHHRAFSPHCHSVLSPNAYYGLQQQNEMGYYQQSQLQQQNVVSPRASSNKITRSASSSFANYGSYVNNNNAPMQTSIEPTQHETLCLFPTHPTGILQERSTIDDNNSSTASTTANTSVIDNDRRQDQFSGHVETGYFDFFSSTGQNGSFVAD